MPPQAECRQAIQVLSDGSAVSKRARGGRSGLQVQETAPAGDEGHPSGHGHDPVLRDAVEDPQCNAAPAYKHAPLLWQPSFRAFGTPARCCSARSAGGLMFLFCCQ